MANITFMIGNGFDISCGLHTSYADFYKWLFSLETADLRVERLKLKLKEDKTVDNNYWSDFELWLGQYTVEFNEVFLDEFLHPFDSVHELMIQFIRNERAKISNQLFSSDGINGLKNSVLNFYQELPPISRDAIQNMLNSSRENVVFQFITFNYTDCIDLCVKGLSKEPHYEQATIYGKRAYYIKPEVIHVHGRTDLFPVLGVCDKKYIKNKELLKNQEFSNLILKEKNVISVGQTWYRDVKQQIANSSIICLFGLSLGASDSFWWQEIVGWLKVNKNHHVIVFWHSGFVINTISSYRYSREIRKVQELLVCHSELKPQEKDELLSRVHIVFNSSTMLNIKSCSEQGE